MQQPAYSFIIPVYNRPDEISELLQSFTHLEEASSFEIVIVEDGSERRCDEVIKEFQKELDIRYFFKPNSGPGDSRNFGMKQANADYYIILDSDVILPSDYLTVVHQFLSKNHVDCFGGPDAADQSFSPIQKAINFSMTSYLTTGGIRGHKTAKEFQPRSFNMGLSRKAFESIGGFKSIHPGEDPDLVLRLWDMDMKTAFIEKARVYHKRRISWILFFKQMYKFGSVRPILNKWHPRYNKLAFWFPSIFMLVFLISLVLLFVHVPYLFYLFLLYFALLLMLALIQMKKLKPSLLALWAVFVQFTAYGSGYLRSTILLNIYTNRSEKQLFPNLFFPWEKS
jgi:glycosyltransferase involved in cell wall biosynthesis